MKVNERSWRSAAARALISRHLKNMDARVRAVLADKPVKRTDVSAAHEKVFGARPDKAVDGGKSMLEWCRRRDGDVTRLARAGLLLKADGNLAVPSGRTKNPGIRSTQVESTGATILKPSVAKAIVDAMCHVIDPAAIERALAEHGYTFDDCDTSDGVFRRIVDPVQQTPHRRARAKFIRDTRAMLEEMVAEGNMLARKVDDALAKRVARWDATNPEHVGS